MDENKKWIIKDDKSVFKSKIFDIHKLDCYLPSKNIKNDFYTIHINNWVNTFALTEYGKVILVKQHRMGKNIVTFEVPTYRPDIEREIDLIEEVARIYGYNNIPDKNSRVAGMWG